MHFTFRYNNDNAQRKNAKKAKLGQPGTTEDKETNLRLVHQFVPRRSKRIIGVNTSTSKSAHIMEAPKVMSRRKNNRSKAETGLPGMIKKRDDIAINKWVSILYILHNKHTTSA